MSSIIVQQGKFSDMIAGAFKDIRANSRQNSFSKTLRFAIQRWRWEDIVHNHTYYLFSQDITYPLSDLKPKIPITFRLATRDDLPLIETLHPLPSGLAADARIIDRGDLFCLALDGERLVGSQMASIFFEGWQKSPIPPQHAYLAIAHLTPVSPADAYTHGLYIHPDYRGQGIASPFLVYSIDELYKRGVRRVFNTILTDNELALRASYKIGRRPMATIQAVQILQWVYMRTELLTDDPLAARLGGATPPRNTGS